MSDLEKFDMFKFGGLVNQVEHLQGKVDAMDKDIKALLELANRSKGSLFAIMSITAAVSTFVGFIAHYFSGK